MHKISAKRQVTLPKTLCGQLDINPGDCIEFFEHQGRLTIVKKERGASKGSLQHLRAKANISDEESLRNAILLS